MYPDGDYILDSLDPDSDEYLGWSWGRGDDYETLPIFGYWNHEMLDALIDRFFEYERQYKRQQLKLGEFDDVL